MPAGRFESRPPEQLSRALIVGGGIAGLEAAAALRGEGYRGALTLLSAERHRPYDRPPLSKEVLVGDADGSDLEADWNELGVDLRLGCIATALRGAVVETEQGEFGFDGLIVATGAAPVRLPFEESSGAVRYLRTIDDALALRPSLVPGVRVVIVGAGWIGAEVATAAAAMGCKVTVLEAAGAPVADALPPEISNHMVSWYADAGVELCLESPVVGFSDGRVQVADGGALPADVVVVGVGVRPETGWLSGSGVELDDRGFVVVDSGMRTSRPGVVAVGDCTAWESARYERRLPGGHWDHALRSPATAAATLLGGDETYDPVPYFWSDQFGRKVQYVGHWSKEDTLVFRGDPSGPVWSACWICEDHLRALLTVGRSRDVSQARKAILADYVVDPTRLADESISITDACLDRSNA